MGNARFDLVSRGPARFAMEMQCIRSNAVKIMSVADNWPRAGFAAFLLAHVAVWTLLPALLYRNLPPDIIEGLIYGREWQLGYAKLPPLPWWMIEAAHRLFNVDFSYYALGQVSVAVGFLFVWMTARSFVGALGAICSILILDGQYFMNFVAFKFNHNVIQLPLWALAGYSYWLALRTGRLSYWLLLGAAVGTAFWAKYFVVILAIPLASFLLIDADARRHWTTAGPWAALIMAILIAAPHLEWLIQHNFIPYAYVDAMSAPRTAATDHIFYPLQFAFTEIGISLPCLFIATPIFFSRPPPLIQPVTSFDRRILTLLAFGPAFTVLAMSFVLGRGLHSHWGYPLWIFTGPWFIAAVNATLDANIAARVAERWVVVSAGLSAAFIVSLTILPSYDHIYRDAFLPGDLLGAELSYRFYKATGQPLAYVVGDRHIGGNTSHYAPEQPRLLILGDPQNAPWIDLDDLKRRGAVIVWAKTSEVRPPMVWESADMDALPSAFSAFAGNAKVQQPFKIPFREGNGILEVGWALLGPDP